MTLTGEIALVTGASRGIGAETARALAAEGAAVVITTRQMLNARSLVAEIEAAGGRALPVVCDMADLASVEGVPGIAPAAKQMGTHAARNIVLRVENRPTRPFRYRDYGQLATIGRNAAVAVMGKVKLSGFPAWLVWLVAHIYFLINFRNRVIVMIDWAWAYFTYQRYARIVIGAEAVPSNQLV